ncbi:MAG TPA: NAD-dependent protein deacylase, partial [Lutibacter sp.]|nr:NAD-dependent protein deacylase [Lutibacter sp.]
DFYNKRRAQLLTVFPNEAHKAIVELENKYQVTIITQNVDDLHERAGSSQVLHLHGELLKARSTSNPNLIYDWKQALYIGNLCEEKSQLRPHIIWFGENVPLFDEALEITAEADILIIIGTSMQVYPAAHLVNCTKPEIPIYFIDPKPIIQQNQYSNLTVLAEKASVGVVQVVKQLIG